MSHRVVAAQASELPAGSTAGCAGSIASTISPMAITAGLLGDLPAVRLDLNIVLVAADGEEKRMPEAVGRLGRILADKVCRSVAAIAGRHRAVRRLEPAVELLLHNVAVGAGRRIVSQIGPTLGIGKSVGADADGDADYHAEQDALDGARLIYVSDLPIIERPLAWEE